MKKKKMNTMERKGDGRVVFWATAVLIILAAGGLAYYSSHRLATVVVARPAPLVDTGVEATSVAVAEKNPAVVFRHLKDETPTGFIDRHDGHRADRVDEHSGDRCMCRCRSFLDEQAHAS